MPTIGVRQLRNEATQILRAVRQDLAEYVISLRGEPVAILRPYTQEDDLKHRAEGRAASLERIEAIAREIGDSWQTGDDAVEILAAQRDERWP